MTTMTAETIASERFQRGLATFRQLDAVAADNFVSSLQELAPDLVRFTIELAFGEILSRNVLDLKTRELATIGVLAAMGTAQSQLELHIGGALRAGATQQEIVEMMLQVSVYAGFPAGINGIKCAKKVFASSGSSTQDDFWNE